MPAILKQIARSCAQLSRNLQGRPLQRPAAHLKRSFGGARGLDRETTSVMSNDSSEVCDLISKLTTNVFQHIGYSSELYSSFRKNSCGRSMAEGYLLLVFQGALSYWTRRRRSARKCGCGNPQ